MTNFLEGINLEYYKIFYFVAREKNITKASKKLFISQPAVTQTINKLESLIGDKLFIRLNKGIELTSLGKSLLVKVEEAFDELALLPKIINSHKNILEGKIKIGGGTNILISLLPEAIQKFSKANPNISFSTIDDFKTELLRNLKIGEIDMVIALNEELDKNIFETYIIREDEFVFFCHNNLEVNVNPTLKEFENYPLILPHNKMTTRKVFEEAFKNTGFKANCNFEISGQNLVVELVEKELGIGFLPYSKVKLKVEKKEFKIIKSPVAIKPLEYVCIVLKSYASPATKEFLKYLLEK